MRGSRQGIDRDDGDHCEVVGTFGDGAFEIERAWADYRAGVLDKG